MSNDAIFERLSFATTQREARHCYIEALEWWKRGGDYDAFPWARLNEWIIERWSVRALQQIKKGAWQTIKARESFGRYREPAS